MSELIVDWPRKPSRVCFALEKNTIRPIYKSKEDKRATWDKKAEKNKFKKNAIRDATFFKQLRKSQKEVDLSHYDDRVCAWGLERVISHTDNDQTVMIRNYVRKSLLLMQEIQAKNGTSDENLIALMSKDASTALQVRAHNTGLHYEDEVRKLGDYIKG